MGARGRGQVERHDRRRGRRQAARLGPLPIPDGLGRALTSLHPGVLRSAFAGQGNAILLGRGLRVAARHVLALNPPAFRRRVARDLGLDLVERLAWGKERRICQAVRAERDGGGSLVVANLHATGSGDGGSPRPRSSAPRPGRARSPARESRSCSAATSTSSGRLLEGWSEPGAGIDQVLVRGARPSPLRAWPDERRRRAGMLLSDHAPVELEVEIP